MGGTHAGNDVIAWPLSDLLDQKGITHIDFWSLDIEDGELNALNGVNWDKHRPSYIMIEVWHRNPKVSKGGGMGGAGRQSCGRTRRLIWLTTTSLSSPHASDLSHRTTNRKGICKDEVGWVRADARYPRP